MIRRSVWRRTFVAACLPYVMLAVFVDFVHVHTATNRPLSVASSNGPAIEVAVNDARQTGSPCAVCLWLRAGPRLAPQVSVEGAQTALQSESVQQIDDAPVSPIPHPATFRGPPRPAFG